MSDEKSCACFKGIGGESDACQCVTWTETEHGPRAMPAGQEHGDADPVAAARERMVQRHHELGRQPLGAIR